MGLPRFTAEAALEQYLWIKKSAAAFDYFQEPMELAPAGVFRDPPSLRRLIFTRKERSELLKTLLPWYEEALDQSYINNPPPKVSFALPSNEGSLKFNKTLHAYEHYYDSIGLGHLLTKILIQELDTIEPPLQPAVENIQDDQFVNDVKRDFIEQKKKKKDASAKKAFNLQSMTKSLDTAQRHFKEFLQKEISGTMLDGTKKERINTSWLTVVTEAANVIFAMIAFIESLDDLRKAQDKVEDFNTWLDRELVKHSTLIADYKKLHSMELSIVVKQLRDDRAGKRGTAMDAGTFNELLNGDLLFKKEAALLKGVDFKGENNKNIYDIQDKSNPQPALSLAEYHNALWKAAEKFDKEKDADIGQLSQTQFVQMMIVLEERYAEKIIDKNAEAIAARNNLYVFRINQSSSLDEKDKEKKLKENKETITKLVSQPYFYDKLMEPHSVKNWKEKSAEIIAWTISEDKP